MRTTAQLALLILLALGARSIGAAEPAIDLSTTWLREYVRIDSSTPDGARRAGALLKGILHDEGVATKWIVAPSGQPFLYARSGRSEPESAVLVLLHHLDVVPAGGGWSTPPFAAEIFDGSLYGRGAIDDKSLGIAHLVSFLRFRQTTNPKIAVVFLAVGGEETGGEEGLAWLIENHADLFENVAAVFTEGGTNRVYGESLAWWGIEVAQKRPMWLLARASGRPGHGASINLHSAPHRLIRGLSQLVDRPLEFRVTPEARMFLESLAPLESPAFASVVDQIDDIMADPEPATRLLPGLPGYFLDTIQVNVLEAGTDVNVTPEIAEAKIDIRLLPDTDESALLEDLRHRVGPDVELEVILSSPQVASSPVDHFYFDCLERTLAPAAPVVPAFIMAVTDARYLREEGVPVYGFSPFRLDTRMLRGIHAGDEHLPLTAFAQGIETMWSVVSRCTSD